MSSGIEQARFKAMLESLQQQDPEINHIVVYSAFVVCYLLQQDGPNPGWRKANIEGPVYLVRRRSTPRYQLFVKNKFNTNDLLEDLHPDWELDCQKNYIFYKVEDASKRIRGLWFHDDMERQKVETFLEKTLKEIRTQRSEAQIGHQPANLPVQDACRSNAIGAAQTDSAQERVTVSMASLKAALHALADDEAFLRLIMRKLADAQAGAKVHP